jgi:hypothetical protein
VQTIYSNLVGLKANPNELVLEFSCFIPERPGQGPPADLKPEVRVVLIAAARDTLVQAFQQAKAARDKISSQPPKVSPGFTTGGKV